MKNTNKLLLGILLASNLASLKAFHLQLNWNFDELDDYFEQEMEETINHMNQIHKAIHKATRPLHIAQNDPKVVLKDEDRQIVITISDIDTQKLDATVNNASNRLVVTTPSDNIAIGVQSNIVGIEISRQHEAVKKDKKNDNDRETNYEQYVGRSLSRIEQLVDGKPLLDQQTIDYDQDNKQLIITIPKQEVKKDKAVPINRISKKNVSLAEQQSAQTATPPNSCPNKNVLEEEK